MFFSALAATDLHDHRGVAAAAIVSIRIVRPIDDRHVGHAAFEPPQKNSGIMGGKFIQRGRVKKPNSHEYYTQADFYTGARIEFNKFGFYLYQADEYSLSYMESDPESHPMSDVNYIAEQLGPVLKEKASVLSPAFEAADPSGTGFVSYETLQDVLSENDMDLNDQVLITLMRRYDYNKDGNIKYSDMMMLAL